MSKSYAERRILDSLDLSLEPNSIYVLRGSSGAGKSTLLNLIAGYLRADTGMISCQERVGYLMQDELLFSGLTLVEMLRLRFLGLLATGTYDSSGSFWAAANGWLDRLGLRHHRKTEISALSGGERRRLEIVAIMLADPGLLMMDEPTSGLDPVNAKAVYSAVWEVRGNRTVLVSTHEASIPELPGSAHELYLENGKVREGFA